MPSHLLRCQGLAVDDHSFALGRLEAGTPSTFAQLRYKEKGKLVPRTLQWCPNPTLRGYRYVVIIGFLIVLQ
jgi:hypothetical protein